MSNWDFDRAGDGTGTGSGDGWPEDEWDDDPDNPLTAPYPLTYERDEDGLPAGWAPWSRAPDAGGQAGAGHPALTGPGGPLTGQRWRPGGDGRPLADALGMGAPTGTRTGSAHGRRRSGPRRWLIPAGIAVVAAGLGAGTVLLTGGHPAATSAVGRGPATPPAASPATAPLSAAQAQGVLAGYTTLNNEANAKRSDSLLATIETGSSYAIDAGQYQLQLAAGAAAYPAFGPVQAAYYIPRAEPARGPHWFAVRVSNAYASSAHKVMSTEYLLFTQTAPGGRWRDAVEPYALAGASTPQVAVGADGLATAVSPTATSVAVPPGRLAAVTAASLDGAGPVASPGNLADQSDQRFWQGKLPAASVTDRHAATAGPDGQEFALLTTDGGALVFYTDTATVTITAPAGSALHLTVPGYYSPAQALSTAGLSYLDQFAAYDPPAGGNAAAPRVVADYSGITGKN